MAEPYLVDNDVALKCAAYSLETELVSLFQGDEYPPAMLNVAKYVLRSVLEKSSRLTKKNAIAKRLESLFNQLVFLEPTDEEVSLAAEFETTALQAGRSLDIGEAQLLAVLITRSAPGFVTGDKRAIKAMLDIGIKGIEGRVICLEQVLLCFLQNVDANALRAQVCSEGKMDNALSNCFACRSVGDGDIRIESVLDGLKSYINDIRTMAGAILIEDDVILSLAT